MKELEGFEGHLDQIKEEEWKELFDLIPEIERTKNFGETVFPEKSSQGVQSFPFVNQSQIVTRFVDVIRKLEITPVFDWMEWSEGKSMLEHKETDYHNLDTVTLCKLLTVILRADRFAEGYLVGRFNDGTLLDILKALEQKR